MNVPMRPHFVGAPFDRWPYISGIGAFLRVTRLNRYERGDYRFAFGISVRHVDDLNHVMTFSVKRKEQLSAALDVPPMTRTFWDYGHWLPFQCDEALVQAKHHFRYCPQCLNYGYHSLLHQLPWMHRCPWHGDGLRTTCLKCRRPMRLDGLSFGWLGTCKCGFDHVIEKCAVRGFNAPLQVERFCSMYLHWAETQRNRTRLVGPSPHARSMSVLDTAFVLPTSLAWRTDRPETDPHIVHRTVARPEPESRRATEDLFAALTRLESLGDSQSAMIEATGRLAVRIASAACRLARELPPNSLSDTEMTLFLEPAGVDADRSFVPARRKSILEIRSLPLTVVGCRSYLDLHCIAKVTRQVGLSILRLHWPGWPVKRPAPTREETEDLQVCLSAIQELVARSYAEGIRVVMGRYMPDLYRPGRNRPHLSEPWVLLRKEAGSRLEIEIFWARLGNTPG